MASSSHFDRTRDMKLSNLANYHNPLFDARNNLIPPALFNSDGRISSWPWFCMNDVTTSTASSTATNLSYSKLNERKQELKDSTNSNDFMSNQQKSPFSCPSKTEIDGVKNCNISNSTKNSETFEKGLEKTSSSTPTCSPVENISSFSSPPLEGSEVRSINLDTSLSPSGSSIHIDKIQVKK